MRRRLSYAVCVCNEHRELDKLLRFLEDVRDRESSEIVVLVDSAHATKKVREVLARFPLVRTVERSFDRKDFSAHKNFLGDQCHGDIIFNIDADEIPQETLMDLVQKLLNSSDDDSDWDVIYVPRINVCPGYTQRFLDTHGFKANQVGWINWPDYQGRIYKKGLRWVGKVHEKIESKKTPRVLEPNPMLALWHIKSTERQNSQNALYSSQLSASQQQD